jgi:hypothetical protein
MKVLCRLIAFLNRFKSILDFRFQQFVFCLSFQLRRRVGLVRLDGYKTGSLDTRLRDENCGILLEK